jgi:hypothetical protein
MATIPDIKNKWQYEAAKERVAVAAKAIEDNGGFLEGPRHWVHAYTVLCGKMLDYEIERDLIPELL